MDSLGTGWVWRQWKKSLFTSPGSRKNDIIWVRFLRTGNGPELCDFFKKFEWLLWPNVKNNAVFFNWLLEIFFTKVLGKYMGHSDTTTLHYTTLKNTLVQYTTVTCSTSNSSQLIKQSGQTPVVSPWQIRYKTMSDPTGNILNYTTQQCTPPS